MRFKRTIQQFLESSIFRRYMITYVLIFLFPLALIPTTLYSVNNALLTRHICSTQMSMVKQARRALDYEARRYNTIAVMLSNEPYVQNLADVDADMMQPVLCRRRPSIGVPGIICITRWIRQHWKIP